MARLSEIFELQMGKTPARANSDYWEGGTNSWVSIADLSRYEKYVEGTKERITDEAVEESGIKIVPPNTVIMSFKLSLGKTAITREPIYTNEAIMAFIPKANYIVSPNYFFYMLSEKDWSEETNRAVMGATLNKSTLGKIDIVVPPIKEQQYVADVLDKLTHLISLRKQQLGNLDELVKARFVEMFGDMLLNPKSWPERTLDTMADIVSGITKGRKTKSNELFEVPYMAVSNVKDGYIDWKTVKTILATTSEIDQYRLLPDDVLMTEGGDPDKLGRGAIIREPLENCIHQNHIFRVRLDRSTILPEFFSEYLQHQKAKRYFLRCAKQTTGIASINMQQLRALPVLAPPMKAQEAFTGFLTGVDRQKLTIQQSLNNLELLKKSLMQEYFAR